MSFTWSTTPADEWRHCLIGVTCHLIKCPPGHTTRNLVPRFPLQIENLNGNVGHYFLFFDYTKVSWPWSIWLSRWFSGLSFERILVGRASTTTDDHRPVDMPPSNAIFRLLIKWSEFSILKLLKLIKINSRDWSKLLSLNQCYSCISTHSKFFKNTQLALPPPVGVSVQSAT